MWLIKPTKHWNESGGQDANKENSNSCFPRVVLVNIWLINVKLISSNGKFCIFWTFYSLFNLYTKREWAPYHWPRNSLFNNAIKPGLANKGDHTTSEKQGQLCSRCRSLLGKCLGNESAISPLLPRQITHFHHFLSPPTLLLKRWRQRDQYWPTIYDDDSEMQL